MSQTSIRTILGAVALTAGLGIAAPPAAAQEENRERELREQQRELTRQLRAIERQLMELSGERWRHLTVPRVLTMATNRARMGVTVQTRASDETDEIGAVLEHVVPNGPADEAGLRAGDIVTAFNGESLLGRYPAAGRNESEPARKLIDLVAELEDGNAADVTYRRDGREFTTTVTLRHLDDPLWFSGDFDLTVPRVEVAPRFAPRERIRIRSSGDGSDFIVLAGGPWYDIELVTLNEGLGRYFGTSDGLLVVHAPEQEGSSLQAGDVILTIGGREVDTPSRALRILRSYDQSEDVTMEIMRDQRRTTITITVPEPDDRHFEYRRFQE